MKPLTCLGQTVLLSVLSLFITGLSSSRAGEINPAPPRITIDKTTNGGARLAFPYPATLQYQVYSAGSPGAPYLADSNSGALLGPTFTVTNGGPARFYRVSAT